MTIHYFTVTLYVLKSTVLWIYWQYTNLPSHCTYWTQLSSWSNDNTLLYSHTVHTVLYYPLDLLTLHYFTATLYILKNTVLWIYCQYPVHYFYVPLYILNYTVLWIFWKYTTLMSHFTYWILRYSGFTGSTQYTTFMSHCTYWTILYSGSSESTLL